MSRERERERETERPQKPEEFFTLLSWRGSRAGRHQRLGGLLSRPWGFQLPSSNIVEFSLIVNYVSEPLIMKDCHPGVFSVQITATVHTVLVLFTRLQSGRGEEQSEQLSSIRHILSKTQKVMQFVEMEKRQSSTVPEWKLIINKT